MNKRLRNYRSFCPVRGSYKVIALSLNLEGQGKGRNLWSTIDNRSIGLGGVDVIKSVERYESRGRGSQTSGGMFGEESSKSGSESISPTKNDESDKDDKLTTGNQLVRRVVGRVGLD
ncbi:MAG: hypothetical protein EZS28_055652 [Streblomastix strix]|uniref:Uncharacterized protein n=1 Tax=Streblomastix strix TaxID=222440 RepID=A0A5J4Q0C6_9EUKA|nr:MAG: hypothetical protein EZS28_055652 [Streblomastix strix]